MRQSALPGVRMSSGPRRSAGGRIRHGVLLERRRAGIRHRGASKRDLDLFLLAGVGDEGRLGVLSQSGSRTDQPPDRVAVS